MDIVNNLLLWVHLMALAMAGAAAFGLPVVGSKMASASAETRPVLFSVAKGISSVSRAALGLLIITGPLLAWLKFGGVAGFTLWFTIKMVLVVLLLISVIFAGMQMKKAEGGDRAAAGMLPRIGVVNLLLLLGIVLCAVFAFS